MKHLYALIREIEKAIHAEERFARQVVRSLWRLATRFGFKHDDIHDIVHETLSEVLMKIDTQEFRGHASITTFAYTIGKNICLKRLKKRTRPKHGGNAPHLSLDHVHIHLLEADPHTWNPLELLKKKELHNLTLQSIHKLEKQEYRDVFRLVLEGYKRAEIGNALNMPITRVDAILNYGRKKLSKYFRRFFH